MCAVVMSGVDVRSGGAMGLRARKATLTHGRALLVALIVVG